MKRIVLFSGILLVGILSSYGQAPPQAFNYSSVIRGSNNQALPNKLVALRLSILSGGPTGTIEYQETHSDTTDQFGVVNLAIGQGIAQQGVFSTIDWGSNPHYLQVELDDNGGSNFQMMGTAQLLRVPYALYAEKSTYSVSTNSTGSDLFFPDGIQGTPVIIPGSTSYTVPIGKTLYITSGSSDVLTYMTSGVDTFFFHSRAVIQENTTVAASASTLYNGFLVDKVIEVVNWKTTNSYTVPTGKTLYLISFRNEGIPSFFIDGSPTSGAGTPGLSLLVLPAGTNLLWQNSWENRNWIFTGYLR